VVEIKLAAPGGAKWYAVKVRKVEGRWLLLTRGGAALIAAGQLARWPPAGLSEEWRELRRRLRRCRYSCGGRWKGREVCRAECSTFSEIDRLKREENFDNLPGEIKSILEKINF
jgi:hypothetical protein